VQVEPADGVTYVELHGELDLSCEEQFSEAVEPVRHGRLVLDLRGLTFIDSAGLHMLVRTWLRSREDGFTLEIAGRRDQVAKVFRIAGLDGVLPLVDEISLNGDSG
jgi:anti-sigma B factor antagonist